MKKVFLLSLIFALAGCYVLGILTDPVKAAEKNKYGGILKINFARTSGVIGDPLLLRAWNHTYVDFVLQTLLRPSNDKFGGLEPELATSWEMAPDKSHYTFNLRKGVKFHDGTDFNAQAVKWNLDRWVGSPRVQLSMVKSIDVIDDYTVRFNLSGWEATILNDFGNETFMISPIAFEKKGQEWAKYNPVGTGPFKVVEWKRNTYLKYEKFADYWEKGLPYLDGIVFTMIPDPMTAIASLRKGDLHALRDIDPISASELKKIGGFDIISTHALHANLRFNSMDPRSVWSDRRMREALEYAIDKESITNRVLRGFSDPIYETVHSINILTDPGTVPRKYNPEKARQLIKEAGMGVGHEIKFTYFGASPTHRDIASVIQNNLREVGIKMEFNPVTFAAYMSKQFEPSPSNELMFWGQRGSPGDILASTKQMLHPDSIYIKGIKRPEGFDELLEKALQSMNTEEQLGYLSKMEKLAYDFAMFIPVHAQHNTVVQSPKVKDAVWYWAGKPIPYLRRAWVSEK